MTNTLEGEKGLSADSKQLTGCCAEPAQLQILSDFKAKKATPDPCCDLPSGFSDAAGEQRVPQDPKKAFQKTFRYPAVIGLIGLSLLTVAAGLLPGLFFEILRRELLSHLIFVARAVRSILPFFVVSVGISAWVTSSGFSDRIQAVFHRREVMAIWGAAAVGAVIPICSCGVIPLIAALLAGGVPLAPVMAFWLSSPLMSPEMFFLTAGVLGIDYALARLISAVAIGAGAGFFIYLMSSKGLLDDQLHGMTLPRNDCCSATENQPDARQNNGLWKKIWPEAWQISLFLGKWLLIAFVLESLIAHYIEPAWIAHILGKDRFFAIPLATAIGIPLYTSGVAAIPIVAGLVNSGMGHGAALAFLVAGPVTTIPAMTAVFALVKRRTFFIYLGAGIVGSLVSGYIYQVIAG